MRNKDELSRILTELKDEVARSMKGFQDKENLLRENDAKSAQYKIDIRNHEQEIKAKEMEIQKIKETIRQKNRDIDMNTAANQKLKSEITSLRNEHNRKQTDLAKTTQEYSQALQESAKQEKEKKK